MGIFRWRPHLLPWHLRKKSDVQIRTQGSWSMCSLLHHTSFIFSRVASPSFHLLSSFFPSQLFVLCNFTEVIPKKDAAIVTKRALYI
jgi:hypothetical protein